MSNSNIRVIKKTDPKGDCVYNIEKRVVFKYWRLAQPKDLKSRPLKSYEMPESRNCHSYSFYTQDEVIAWLPFFEKDYQYAIMYENGKTK